MQSETSPENAARERSRVRTLRQAFLALQAALPAVPPDTKLSKLDVLVLATSYIAHLTRTLGHELPGPAWPPFLRGLRYLHPLKVGRGDSGAGGMLVGVGETWNSRLGPQPWAELTGGQLLATVFRREFKDGSLGGADPIEQCLEMGSQESVPPGGRKHSREF